jgi:hypothetical protein
MKGLTAASASRRISCEPILNRGETSRWQGGKGALRILEERVNGQSIRTPREKGQARNTECEEMPRDVIVLDRKREPVVADKPKSRRSNRNFDDDFVVLTDSGESEEDDSQLPENYEEFIEEIDLADVEDEELDNGDTSYQEDSEGEGEEMGDEEQRGLEHNKKVPEADDEEDQEIVDGGDERRPLLDNRERDAMSEIYSVPLTPPAR